MWVKGLPTAAPDLFKGKRRRTRITVQGRFKRSVPFEEVRFGVCRWSKPIVRVRPQAKVLFQPGLVVANRELLTHGAREPLPPMSVCALQLQ